MGSGFVSDAVTSGIGSRTPGQYGARSASSDRASTLTLQELTIDCAWNVQGDAGHAALGAAAQRLFSLDLPAPANTLAAGDGWAALWMGPRSWLLLRHSLPQHDIRSFIDARDTLNAVGAALFDVSASRVAYRIAGALAADVLARSCPLDLHRRAFAPGSVQQSLLGHVNALFLRSQHGDQGDAFTVTVARSFALDVWGALCTASAGVGYEVLPPRAFSWG
jgi:sarcosine oxidase subunit gamma